ncbi:MAG: hypothetical protein CMF41_04420, partial [Legionellales bacterium]|nr:hypothetical protein [Legionellales bacterium]
MNFNIIGFSLIFLNALAPVDLLLPALPIINVQFVHSDSTIQWISAFFLFTSALTQLIIALNLHNDSIYALSKNIIYLYVCSMLICLVAPTYHIFLIGRLLSGVACGALIMMGSFSIANHCYQKPDLLIGTVSYVSAISTLSPLVMPIISGYIVDYTHWRFLFLFLILLSLILLQFRQYAFVDGQVVDQKNTSIYGMVSRFDIICLSVICGLGLSLLIDLISFSSMYLQNAHHFTVRQFSLFCMAAALTSTLSRLMIPKITKHFSLTMIFYSCCSLIVFSLLLFIVTFLHYNNVVFIFAGLIQFGSASILMTISAVEIQKRLPLALKGIGLGSYGFIKFIIPFIISILIGHFTLGNFKAYIIITMCIPFLIV